MNKRILIFSLLFSFALGLNTETQAARVPSLFECKVLIKSLSIAKKSGSPKDSMQYIFGKDLKGFFQDRKAVFLNNLDLTDEQLIYLSRYYIPEDITKIDLSHNPRLTSKSINKLIESHPKIANLNLFRTKTDGSITGIIGKHLQNIKYLTINKADEKSLNTIKETMPKLKTLDIRNTVIAKSVLKKFISSLNEGYLTKLNKIVIRDFSVKKNDNLLTSLKDGMKLSKNQSFIDNYYTMNEIMDLAEQAGVTLKLAQTFRYVQVNKQKIFDLVYDGDTLEVDLPELGPGWGRNFSIRVRGVDTAERKGYQGLAENYMAIAARNLVINSLINAKEIQLIDVIKGKYFRAVVDLQFDGKSLSSQLLKYKLAVPYQGDTKITTEEDWLNLYKSNKDIIDMWYNLYPHPDMDGLKYVDGKFIKL